MYFLSEDNLTQLKCCHSDKSCALLRQGSTPGEPKLDQMDIITDDGNGYTCTETKILKAELHHLKLRPVGLHLWDPTFETVSRDANNHQMSPLWYVTHINHSDFSHQQLFIV